MITETSLAAFGLRLRGYRSSTGQSLQDVAVSIGIDRTYLSKLENGLSRPSVEVLTSLVRHFSLSGIEAMELAALVGRKVKIATPYPDNSQISIKSPAGKEVHGNMNEPINNQPVPPKQGVQVEVPNNVAVLYTDSAFVTSNQYGVVLDFAQTLGPTNKQVIVTRVGMSLEHAKALMKALSSRLVDVQLKTADKKTERASS